MYISNQLINKAKALQPSKQHKLVIAECRTAEANEALKTNEKRELTQTGLKMKPQCRQADSQTRS